MKILRFIVFVFILSVLKGCIPVVDESVTLSFWTDNDIEGEGYNMFFINERYIGDLSDTLVNPICSDPGLLEFESKKSEDLTLSVRNIDGESIEIGVVNLFSVSTGIKIKPSEKGDIFVDQSLDDICTLIRLNWEE